MSQKCTSWRGHRFEGRFDIIPPEPAALEGLETSVSGAVKYVDALTQRIYVHDICVRCGHVIEPTIQNHIAALDDEAAA